VIWITIQHCRWRPGICQPHGELRGVLAISNREGTIKLNSAAASGHYPRNRRRAKVAEGFDDLEVHTVIHER